MEIKLLKVERDFILLSYSRINHMYINVSGAAHVSASSGAGSNHR